MKINSIIDLVKDLDTSRQTKNLNKLLIRILLHLQVEFSFEAISQQLQALLKENPLSLQEIKDKMQVPENHLMKVVSYLVSEEIIRQENGYLKF